jgi:hypothetical protein
MEDVMSENFRPPSLTEVNPEWRSFLEIPSDDQATFKAALALVEAQLGQLQGLGYDGPDLSSWNDERSQLRDASGDRLTFNFPSHLRGYPWITRGHDIYLATVSFHIHTVERVAASVASALLAVTVNFGQHLGEDYYRRIERMLASADLQTRAFREAGRAVTACVLGRPFGTLSVTADDDLELSATTPWSATSSTRSRWPIGADAELMTILGGVAAEAIRIGFRGIPAADREFNLVQDHELQNLDNEMERSAYTARLFGRVKELLGEPRHWLAVEALADELISKACYAHDRSLGVMANAEVRRVVGAYMRVRRPR